VPSTWTKQCVVWPIPLGNIFPFNIALITVLLPFDVLRKENKQNTIQQSYLDFYANHNSV
jgi:uncharacterized protein YceK